MSQVLFMSEPQRMTKWGVWAVGTHHSASPQNIHWFCVVIVWNGGVVGSFKVLSERGRDRGEKGFPESLLHWPNADLLHVGCLWVPRSRRMQVIPVLNWA